MTALRLISLAWFSSLAGAFLLGFEIWFRPRAAAYAYLAAFGFSFSTLVGALALLAITRAVGARWFVVLRNLALGIVSTVVLLPLFFAPIAFALRVVYPWAGVTASPELAQASYRAQVLGYAWLSPTPFLLRAAGHLGMWIALAELLRHAARAAGLRAKSWWVQHDVALNAVALPLLGFSGSWASFDWLMSAVPGWDMTSVGLYVLTGGFAAALGVLAVLADDAKRRRLLPSEVGAAHFHALGRLLFAAVCLWAYIAVSQLIIVWSANLPREAAFYLPRAQGSFRYLAGLLVVGHLLLPFVLLLSRQWKMRSAFVAGVGAWIALMHALDLYWLIAPTAHSGASWLDLGPFLVLAGLVALVGRARSRGEPAFPRQDPDLARSLGYESP